MKYKEFIKQELDERTLLEQMAEEAAELSKACLKLIRAKGLNKNYTPLDIAIALDNAREELADVLCCAEMAGISPKEGHEWKTERWARRLGYKDWGSPLLEKIKKCDPGNANSGFKLVGKDLEYVQQLLIREEQRKDNGSM